MEKPLYGEILLVNQSGWRGAGRLEEYFIARSRRFLCLTYRSDFRMKSDVVDLVLEKYERGSLVSRREWALTRFLPKPVRYLFYYAVYLVTAFFSLGRGGWIVTHYPLFCVGQSWLWALKRQRLLYWVWDHFEDEFRAYAALDEHYVSVSPYVLFLSAPMSAAYDRRAPRGTKSRVRGILPLGSGAPVVMPPEPVDGRLGYLGNLRSPDVGLEEVLKTMAIEPCLSLDIIGDGDHLTRLRTLALDLGVASRTRFHGRIMDPDMVAAITSAWQTGLATYPEASWSPYGDSCKVKDYLALGLPVVMTPTMAIHAEIAAENAGEVAQAEPSALSAAFLRIRQGREGYLAGVARLRDKYEFSKLYDEGLTFIRT